MKGREELKRQQTNETNHTRSTFGGITVGIVISTNDPQQMGRLKVLCVMFGDSTDTKVEDLPWCTYMTPFGGMTGYGTRGPEEDESKGLIAYGMWAIPKVGAEVIVACLNGDPNYRIWMGCKHAQYTPHTLPNGRYNALDDGPLSSTEKPIEPQYSNTKEAYTKPDATVSANEYERLTRIVENQAAALDEKRVNNDESVSKIVDDPNKGYSLSRQNPELENTNSTTKENKDSTVYSITTPGFHSLTMDDKAKNCRIKVKTSSGNQIILDDTNQRIYISTSKGKNWIEMDDQGNIDIFAEGNISMRSKKSLSFTADKTINFYAKENIHFRTESEFRIHATSNIDIRTQAQIRIEADQDINIITSQNYRQRSALGTFLEASTTMDLKSGTGTKITATTNDMEILAQTGNTNVTAFTNLNLLASSNVLVTGAQIHHNGPAATPANIANISDPKNSLYAYVPIRIPEHEPWGRISTTEGYSTNESNSSSNILNDLLTELVYPVLELKYNDPKVNKEDRGIELKRGINWRR